MALTKREKYIAMGAGGAIVLLGIYQVVLNPYLEARANISKQTNDAIDQQKANRALFDRQTNLKKVWTEMTVNLKADDSAAESQALGTALDFAQAAGVNITAVKPERSIVVNQFMVTPFRISATGSTPAMARLLNSFENAAIPMRVDDMTLTPMKEGTDNLKIELTLSTLSSKTAADAAKPAVSQAENLSGDQPWNE